MATYDENKPVKPIVKKVGVPGAKTPEEREYLGRCIADMVDAGLREQGSYPNRWKRNLEYYHNEPGEAESAVFNGASDHHQPLSQPIIDTVIEDVVQPIIEADPYVYAQASGGAARRQTNLENNLTYLMRIAGFESACYEAARISAIAGLSPGKVPFEIVAQGFHADTPEPQIMLSPSANLIQTEEGTINPGDVVFCGPIIEVMHPQEAVIYPSRVMSPMRARLFANKREQRVQEVREWQLVGRYFNDKEIQGGLLTAERPGRVSTLDLDTASGTEVSPLDEMVDIWCGHVKLDLNKDGLEEMYEVVIAKEQALLLDLKPYPIRSSWYVTARLRKEHNAYYPASSIADSLQRVQSFYNEMHNQLLDNTQLAGGPPVFMQRGMMDSEVVNYGPREIHFVDVMPDFRQMSISFDATPVVTMIQQLKVDAYASAGVGFNQQGQQLPNKATATESMNVSSFSTKRTTGYREIFAQTFVEPVAYLVLEHYRNNYEILHEVHGDQLKPITKEELNAAYRLKVAGATANTSPVQQAQVIMAIVQNLPAFFEADPTVRAQVNISKLLELLLTAQLPAVDAVFRPQSEAALQMRIMQIAEVVQQGMDAAQVQAQSQAQQNPDMQGGQPDLATAILSSIAGILQAPMMEDENVSDQRVGQGGSFAYQEAQ